MSLEKNVPIQEIILTKDSQELSVLELLIPSPEELEDPNWKEKYFGKQNSTKSMKPGIRDKLRELFSKKEEL